MNIAHLTVIIHSNLRVSSNALDTVTFSVDGHPRKERTQYAQTVCQFAVPSHETVESVEAGTCVKHGLLDRIGIEQAVKSCHGYPLFAFTAAHRQI